MLCYPTLFLNYWKRISPKGNQTDYKKLGSKSIIIPTAANRSPSAIPTGIEIRKDRNGLKPNI
jgi:hypothetical protein